MRQVMRSDPSPSRLRYRLDRMMLTPAFRTALRIGVPSLLVVGALGAFLASAERRAAIADFADTVRAEIEARPEFTVKLMAIDGASEPVSVLVREALPVDFPISSFDLDLEAMKATVADLPPVKSAHLRIRQGGVLQIEIEERAPVALMRSPDGLALVDAEGVVIGLTEGRAAWPELPVVAGEGAHRAIAEGLLLHQAAHPVHERLRGLVRVGERRWDVILDRGQRIMLPQDGAVDALRRVLAMDRAVELLARDVTVVDLRIPRRPVLRMSEYATEELMKIKGLKVGDE